MKHCRILRELLLAPSTEMDLNAQESEISYSINMSMSQCVLFPSTNKPITNQLLTNVSLSIRVNYDGKSTRRTKKSRIHKTQSRHCKHHAVIGECMDHVDNPVIVGVTITPRNDIRIYGTTMCLRLCPRSPPLDREGENAIDARIRALALFRLYTWCTLPAVAVNCTATLLRPQIRSEHERLDAGSAACIRSQRERIVPKMQDWTISGISGPYQRLYFHKILRFTKLV